MQREANVEIGVGSCDEPTLGRPKLCPAAGTLEFVTAGGIPVKREAILVEDPAIVLKELAKSLDTKRGCMFESAYDYPLRYSQWTLGFSNPPLAFESWSGPRFKVSALNERGKIVLQHISEVITACSAVDQPSLTFNDLYVSGKILPSLGTFAEEERSKQNSIFSLLRDISKAWKVEEEVDTQLGLYGAFGYDLAFQFNQVQLKQDRRAEQRELVLYLPDEILVYDNRLDKAWKLLYDFTSTDGKANTDQMSRSGTEATMDCSKQDVANRDNTPEEYVAAVESARQQFKEGNLFECVLSQTFFQNSDSTSYEIYCRLRKRNPSPYMFIINLGENEALVGASPEMFVRVEKRAGGLRVESCPISGTIKRGRDAVEDADRIKEILTSKKEESELTMCTDVDRNDKSRICIPGSVKVLGRRQIEQYSKLIHTVDHVEGYLRDGYDAIDAFLAHAWEVTVTGCPKTWAMQFIENSEKSARAWYGGAVGIIGFDGSLNTGMTLRTVRIVKGVAEVRAGATLLFDSDPVSEEKETQLKASAFREAVLSPTSQEAVKRTKTELHGKSIVRVTGKLTKPLVSTKKVIVVDHEDSFVNTLASYFRECGAEVTTIRYGMAETYISDCRPDLVVMSPGPGKPSDFDCASTLAMLDRLKIPVFGVCLGLQAMVEYFGGELGILDYPVHGKESTVRNIGGSRWNVLSKKLPSTFAVARYHSIYAKKDSLPSVLKVTALTDDSQEVVMAIEHQQKPFAAVQFHPESIVTGRLHGLQIVRNVLSLLQL